MSSLTLGSGAAADQQAQKTGDVGRSKVVDRRPWWIARRCTEPMAV
jgi:hypothetical protein